MSSPCHALRPDATLERMKWSRLPPWLSAVTPALAWLILLAASARGAAEPTFIVIGGGLRDDNQSIYRELLTHHRTGTIVIVPFASADPAQAATRAAERFRAHRADARILTLPDPLAGDEAATTACEYLAQADLVYFTGGDQSRITRRLLADGTPGPILHALRNVAEQRNLVIGGTSAGCAVMSDPMFTGGGSESALADLPATDGESEPDEPAARGVRLGQGLGLIPGVILDSHFPERGRYGRMVAALQHAGFRFGLGVAENRALRVTGRTFTAIGDAAALLVDVGDLAREGPSRRCVRLSLLSHGDTFTLFPEPGHPHLTTTATRVERLPTPAPDAPDGTPWDRNVILTLITRLASDPVSPQRAASERFEVVLSADERTAFAWRDNDPATLRVFNARLDILARQPAP